jgi:hypothetical protein
MMHKFVATFRSAGVYHTGDVAPVPQGHDIESEALQGFVTLELSLYVAELNNGCYAANESPDTATHPRLETAESFDFEIRILAVKILGTVSYYNDSNPDSADDSVTVLPVSVDIDVEAYNKAMVNQRQRYLQWSINSSDVGSSTKRANLGSLVVQQIDFMAHEVILGDGE